MESLHTEKCWADRGAQAGPYRVSRRPNSYCRTDLSSLGCSFSIIWFFITPLLSVYLPVTVFWALPTNQHYVPYARLESVPLMDSVLVRRKLVFSTHTYDAYVRIVSTGCPFIDFMNTWSYNYTFKEFCYISSRKSYFSSSKYSSYFCT